MKNVSTKIEILPMTHYLNEVKMGDSATNVFYAGQQFDAIQNEHTLWVDLPCGKTAYFGLGEEGVSFKFVDSTPTNTQIDRTKVKAAATNKTLVAAVKTVLEAKALVETIRPVVNADHKAEIEANEYTFENSRRFTYEDHLKGAGYLMNESQWQTYAEGMNYRYKAGPFAYMIEGREVGTCPLLIAENMLRIAQRAMMDVFKSLTGTFDTDDLLCSSNGLENLKHGQDLVIGMVVSQNPNL